KKNELLMKNHQNRPTGSLAIPDANSINNNDTKRSGSKREQGNPRGHSRGRGHYGHNHFSNQNYSYHRGGYNGRGRGQRNYTYPPKTPKEPVSSVEVQITVYVPIAPPQRTKMGPQRRLGIYVGYETSSIIRYVEPLTGDVFIARFADFHFNEVIFPLLGKEKKTHKKDVSWSEPSLLYLDPRTKQIANAPARVELPNKQAGNNIVHESQKRLKRGSPIGSKDKNPRKRKGTKKNSDHDENVLDETQDIKISPEKEMNDINKEMSINYCQTIILWDRNQIGDIDEIFSYFVASDIMSGDDDPEPNSIIYFQNRPYWDKWKDAMQAELNLLNKRKVFGPIVTTPRDVKLVGCRWIFVQKRNEKNEVIRYKARLVAQGFSQRPGVDYEETYSPVMDAITFRYLISLAVSINLKMRLMDVVIAYLYGSIDNDIYMKILEEFKIPESLSSKPKEMCLIKLQRSLYGLKQSGWLWYNRLSDYLISKGYKSNLICPCVIIKKTTSGFVIIVVYVDDLNIIGTNKEINEVIMHLKEEFEMKDLGERKTRKGQNRIKTGQNREAWRSREKFKAVAVGRARKTKQNAKRMAKNANAVKSYSNFK
nr:putative RNA-directed DNA polymerase [Tanacetum cinerariifolium]